MKRPSSSQAGYTLLELLIAMALAAVLLVILFAALRLAHKSQTKGTELAELTQKIRILEDRLSWLIRGAYPYLVTKPDGKKLYFSGQDDRIGFVTTSVDSFGKGPEDRAGLKWVSISAGNKGLMIREKVYFLEDVFDDDGGKEFLFDPDVKKLEFEYFDIPDDKDQGDWVSDWDPDEKDHLPSAVKFRITIEVKGKKIELPETIVAIRTTRKTHKPGT